MRRSARQCCEFLWEALLDLIGSKPFPDADAPFTQLAEGCRGKIQPLRYDVGAFDGPDEVAGIDRGDGFARQQPCQPVHLLHAGCGDVHIDMAVVAFFSAIRHFTMAHEIDPRRHQLLRTGQNHQEQQDQHLVQFAHGPDRIAGDPAQLLDQIPSSQQRKRQNSGKPGRAAIQPFTQIASPNAVANAAIMLFPRKCPTKALPIPSSLP